MLMPLLPYHLDHARHVHLLVRPSSYTTKVYLSITNILIIRSYTRAALLQLYQVDDSSIASQRTG